MSLGVLGGIALVGGFISRSFPLQNVSLLDHFFGGNTFFVVEAMNDVGNHHFVGVSLSSKARSWLWTTIPMSFELPETSLRSKAGWICGSSLLTNSSLQITRVYKESGVFGEGPFVGLLVGDSYGAWLKSYPLKANNWSFPARQNGSPPKPLRWSFPSKNHISNFLKWDGWSPFLDMLFFCWCSSSTSSTQFLWLEVMQWLKMSTRLCRNFQQNVRPLMPLSRPQIASAETWVMMISPWLFV